MDAPRDENARAQPGAGGEDEQGDAAVVAGDATARPLDAESASAQPEMTLPTRVAELAQDTVSGDGESVVGDRGDEPALLPAHTVVGRYIVLGHLGSGGMGVVYKAYDPDLNRQIALKLVRVAAFGGGDPATARGRLLREAQGLAQLSHPNVVAIYDVGLFDDGVFLAMEMVSGPTLRAWLRTRPGYREVLRVFVAAGEGLAAAHRAGLVHRDFKPDNVILGEDGRPRVLDFGLVRAVGEGAGDAEAAADERQPREPSRNSLASEMSLTPRAALATGVSLASGESLASHRSHASTATASETESSPGLGLSESSGDLSTPLTRAGAVLGTPRYMSPEQLLGRAVDAKTDQFSFCVALYEAIYGQPPFRSTTLPFLREDVCEGRVRPPPAGVRVPAPLRRAILTGLAPDPNQRHPSMAALLIELGRDRARVWRHRLAIAAVVSSLGLGAWSVLGGRDEGGLALCQRAPHELAAVWNPARRQAVKQAFVAGGVSYAADTFDRVASVLDDYGERWVAMRTQACEATHLAGVQSDKVLDLRMGCLDRRIRSLRALIGTFADEPDRQVVTKAVEASLGLGEIGLCADVKALEQEEPLPERREDRQALEALRGRLDEVNQLNLFGKYREAETLVKALGPEVEALGFPPIEAELAYQTALTLDSLGKYAEAESALKDAIAVALRWGMQELVAKAEAEATYLVGYRLQRHAEALVYAQHAQAVTRGRGDELEAKSLAELAAVYLDQRRYAEAEELYERTLAIRRKNLGPGHPAVASLLNNLAIVYRNQRKYAEAEALYEAALEIKEKALGPEHPAVAKSLHNLAAFYFQQQRYAEAEALFERTLAVYEKAYGVDHPDVAYPLIGLAETAAKQRRFTSVLPLVERAREIREKARVAPLLRADVAFYLARFLWDTGDDRARSRALAREALALYQSAGPRAERERLDVEKWIAEHR